MLGEKLDALARAAETNQFLFKQSVDTLENMLREMISLNTAISSVMVKIGDPGYEVRYLNTSPISPENRMELARAMMTSFDTTGDIPYLRNTPETLEQITMRLSNTSKILEVLEDVHSTAEHSLRTLSSGPDDDLKEIKDKLDEMGDVIGKPAEVLGPRTLFEGVGNIDESVGSESSGSGNDIWHTISNLKTSVGDASGLPGGLAGGLADAMGGIFGFGATPAAITSFNALGGIAGVLGKPPDEQHSVIQLLLDITQTQQAPDYTDLLQTVANNTGSTSARTSIISDQVDTITGKLTTSSVYLEEIRDTLATMGTDSTELVKLADQTLTGINSGVLVIPPGSISKTGFHLPSPTTGLPAGNKWVAQTTQTLGASGVGFHIDTDSGPLRSITSSLDQRDGYNIIGLDVNQH